LSYVLIVEQDIVGVSKSILWQAAAASMQSQQSKENPSAKSRGVCTKGVFEELQYWGYGFYL
jgi:hypothetical protein